jgi:hypothetical protein
VLQVLGTGMQITAVVSQIVGVCFAAMVWLKIMCLATSLFGGFSLTFKSKTFCPGCGYLFITSWAISEHYCVFVLLFLRKFMLGKLM